MNARALFWSLIALCVGLLVLLSFRTEAHGTPQTTCPDLVPELSFSSENPQPGAPVDITVTIANIGSGAAGAFYTYLYVDPADQPPTVTTLDTSYTRIPDLVAGGDLIWTRRGHIFAEAGQHVVYAWTDRNNQVPNECNETNNLVMRTISVGSAGCIPDVFEAGGDNSCQGAQLATSDGAVARHNLCPDGDQDWITFNAEAGVEYEIVAANVDNATELRVETDLQCSGTVRAASARNADSGQILSWPIYRDGPAYVKVESALPSPTGQTEYDLSVTALCPADAYEPDNGCAQARELAPDVSSQRRSFCRSVEEDWMRIWVTAGNHYRLESRNREANASPVLTLYDQCGGQPRQSGAPGAPLEWTADDTGEMLVQVRNSPANSAGMGTGYELLLSSGSAGADGFEPNNDMASARPISLAATPQAHNFATPGDQDWFYLDAVQGRRYRFETYGLSASDTVLCVYGLDNKPLACDDDSGEGLGSLLQWSAPATGRYYVRAYDYDINRSGNETGYQLVFGAEQPYCIGDAFEPDDEFGIARDLLVGATAQKHNFCAAGDSDWLRIWVQAPGVFDIRVDAVGIDADPVATLYDVDGQSILWRNDDFGPGKSARVLWRFTRAGVYYLNITSFDGQSAGRGTEYQVSVIPSLENPTPTPTMTPSPTSTPLPTATPTPTATPGWPIPLPTPNGLPNTLVVTSRQRLASLYGETDANLVMGRVALLMADPAVRGLLLDLDSDANLVRSYTEWQGNLASLERANRVAEGIRSVIWTQIGHFPTIEYIVLVGDDRVIPFRREPDSVERLNGRREAEYAEVTTGSTVGMALAANATLTDDYYGASRSQQLAGRPFYLPDKAVGRLVETPEQIIGTIDRFLVAGSQFEYRLTTGTAFVAGGTALQHDSTAVLCNRLQPRLLNGLNCELNDQTWGWNEFAVRHLANDGQFRVHALHLGGNHWQLQMGNGSRVPVVAVGDTGITFERGIVAVTSAHGGLNVPAGEPHAEDLVETYIDLAEIFVGSTGLTFFAQTPGESLSGKLMNLFIAQIYDLPSIDSLPTVGKAWVRAKQLYVAEVRDEKSYAEYHRKILHVATFYGLPMYQLPKSLSNPDPYPSVRVNPGAVKVASATRPGTAAMNLSLKDGVASLQLAATDDGGYYALDGAVNWNPGVASQPLYAADLRDILSAAGAGARGVIWTGGAYTDVTGFVPVIASVVTDTGGDAVEVASLDTTPADGKRTVLPMHLDANSQQLVVEWGQFDAQKVEQRLFGELAFEFTYSNSPDQIPAEVTAASGQAATAFPTVKLEAHDASGVQRVVVVYTDNRGQFQAIDLAYLPDMQKWVGQLPVLLPSFWLAQVVDGAGNVTLVTHKGGYFQAAQSVPMNEIYWGYIPLVQR